MVKNISIKELTDYKKLLNKKGLSRNVIWQQPFVYCFGRRDDTVIIGGANIYPEQIAPVLFNGQIKDVHSFKLQLTSIKSNTRYFMFYWSSKPAFPILRNN
ncbi:hypothetical protein KJ713_03225 [Patescibacteria group bacterium]|nr:hypothetical protein [Patescibacteria group bacterium]